MLSLLIKTVYFSFGSLLLIFFLPLNLAYSINATENNKIPQSKTKQIISNTYQRLKNIGENGSWDLYVAGRTWHYYGFTKEKLSRFNDHAYGAGFGKRFVDSKGHEDLLYGMLFLESHYEPQFVGGYARQWYYQINKPLAIGLGYTAAISMRRDIARGLPIPIILPVASLKIGRLSFMAAALPYIPPIHNHGVIFFWGKIAF